MNVAPVSGADVTVTFSTSDGTATSGDNDFVTASTVVIPAGDTSGTATVDVNGDTNYEADEDFTVTFSATSHGDDLTVNPNVTTVTIVNDDAPTANDDSDTTDEDTELTSSGSVLDNDSAPAAGASLTAALDQAISEGALTLNADGTYTFDPRGAFDDLQVSESRDATFTYMAVDSRGTTPDSASATVTITVGGVNDAPVANGDPYQVQQGVVLDLVALGLNVLSNDTDVDHPTPIVAVLVDDLTPGTGILTLGNFNATGKEWDGTFVYDADGFSGVTQFTYMAQDPLGANSVKATVTLIGAPAFSIADVTVDEDAGVATLTITLDPVAPAPSSVDYSTTDGSAVAPGDYTGAAATRVDFGTGESTKQIQVPIIDDAIDELVEKFQVVLSNAQGGGDPVAVVSTVADSADVTINDNDDPPVLTVEPAKSLTEGDSGTTDVDITVSLSAVSGLDVTVKYDTVDVTAQDSDNDFTFVLDGMLTIPAGETQTSTNGGTEKITVLGDTKYEADETFKVVFHDAVNATLGTTSTVTIVNDDAPTANANSDTTDEDTELTSSGSVLDNDSTPAAGATLTAALDQAISEGALTLNADGTYTFDPRGAFDDLQVGESRDATFTYMAVDSRGTTPDSAPATVTINVDGVNDAPVAIDDPYQVQQGLPLNVAAPGILGNDTDADGDSLTVALLVDPLLANTGSLTFNGDGSFSYDAEGFSGVTQFTYMAQDPLGANSVKATVALIGAPAFSIADVTVDEGGLATLTITLDPVAPEASSVDYATMDGTAVAPGDYTAKQTTTLNFAPNQSTTEITVQTAQDNIHEINEKFGVVLSNATGGGDPVAVVSTIAGHAYVTITDDETPPTIVPDAKADVNEGDSGTKELEITVKLVGTDTETDVTVAYITNADSAGVGEDYIGTDGTVTFLAGQKTATIKVTINGDTKYELDESFNVNWLEPVSVGSDDTVTLKPKVTVVTIFNDDKPAAGPDRDYTTQEETPLDVAAPGLLAGVADPLNVDSLVKTRFEEVPAI